MTAAPHMLYVPDLPAARKQAIIFERFDALEPGASLVLVNDHDPKPLYYQLIAERGAVFSWQYLQQGPEHWQVEICKNAGDETVGAIAAKDLRKAEVLKKYGIDFCCGGRQTLKQACAATGVEVAVVQAALQAAPANGDNQGATNFARWEPDFLADYIYNQHHLYYYEEGPVLRDLAEKVAARHGAEAPYLYEIAALYQQLQQELDAHFMKEERVLFPFIKALVKAKKTGDFTELAALASLTQPVQMMERDHEAAGELLAEIRKTANDFNAPQGVCQSFQLLYKKLAAFEADLHQHIHLENNILFPKALTLERELRPRR